MKQLLLRLWSVEAHIRAHISFARFLHTRVPLIGPIAAMILDRLLLIIYGVDVTSASIRVRQLSISHPGGVLLGGNGIVSDGRVAIMAGVQFVGRSPDDPEYIRRHAQRRVFCLGDNVVIGTGSVLIGPLDICDNVIIGAMTLVNRSITEPGIYVGVPARRLEGAKVTNAWVAHLDDGGSDEHSS